MDASAGGGGWFAALERFTQRVNRIFLILSAILVLAILALVCLSVIFRYFLNNPLAWALDYTTFLLVFVFFLAISPALQGGNHIEVDLFDPLIPEKWHKAQRMIGKLLTLVFAVALLIFIARRFEDIVDLDELSFTMVHMPLKYIFWIGPIGAAQFLLTAIVDIIRFAKTPAEDVAKFGAATGH